VSENFGDYTYFTQRRQLNNGGDYEVYMRTSVAEEELAAKERRNPNSDIVLDLGHLSFIKDPSQVILEKLTMNDDHSMIGVVLDLDNTEEVTMCVVDIQTGRAVAKISNCS